jgi:hypothetical protein
MGCIPNLRLINNVDKGGPAMGLILLIILILLLMGGLPTWGYSRGWGYGPSGLLGLLVVVLMVLLILDIIPLLHPIYIAR